MLQVATLRRLFSQKCGVTFAAAFVAAAAALEATSKHTAAADGPVAAPSVGSDTPPASGNAVPLPTDKLSCKTGSRPPRTPVVLVCCGSFNPPTIMHMRMVDLASDELLRRGYDVWGAYLSPVADAYGKAGLAPAADRVAMCRLAAEDESRSSHVIWEPDSAQTQAATPSHPDPTLNLTMVYDWEARQPGYTRTLAVLRRVESQLRSWVTETLEPAAGPADGAPAAAGPGRIRESAPGPTDSISTDRSTLTQPPPAATATASPQPTQRLHLPSPPLPSPPLQQPNDGVHPAPPVRAMLLCGGDVLASMAVPGVWRDPDVILREHGVVCVAREGTDLERLLTAPGSVLYDYRDRITVVYDRVGNSVSSSKVRQELAAGRPVRYLVAPSVLSYIFTKGLYGTRRDGKS